MVDKYDLGHSFSDSFVDFFFSRTVIDSPDLIFATSSTLKPKGDKFKNLVSDDSRIFSPI